jgi:hypothetical protein
MIRPSNKIKCRVRLPREPTRREEVEGYTDYQERCAGAGPFDSVVKPAPLRDPDEGLLDEVGYRDRLGDEGDVEGVTALAGGAWPCRAAVAAVSARRSICP